MNREIKSCFNHQMEFRKKSIVTLEKKFNAKAQRCKGAKKQIKDKTNIERGLLLKMTAFVCGKPGFKVISYGCLLIGTWLGATEIAPLMPLDPHFPLEISEQNKETWMTGEAVTETSRLQIGNYLADHTFPWIPLTILFGCSAIAWSIYLVKDRLPKWSFRSSFPKSPWEPIDQAMRELTTVANKKNLETLSSVLRQAMQIKYGCQTQHLTVSEIEKQLDFQDKQTQQALALLEKIDLVKFAPNETLGENSKKWIKEIQDFVFTWKQHKEIL